MNKKIFTLGIVLFMVAIVTGTAYLFIFPYEPSDPPEADDSGATTQGMQEVFDANNQFAFDLYEELKSGEGNIFYSPYSISAALGMTYEGANGKTAEEMKEVFHFPDNLKENFAATYNDINSGSDDYELKTGNALWVQKDYPFLESYMSLVERYYGGKAANVDFVNEPEKTRQTINSFIEQQTNDRIKDLIPPGVLNAMTRLVITNAIYFKGTWEWEFDKSDTYDGDFRVDQDTAVRVPMMFMEPEKARFNYADLGELQILELPYKGGELSMLILLPKQGKSFETGEDYYYTPGDIELSKLEEYKDQMEETSLDAIHLPKFEFETKYFMRDALSAMGMPAAFSMAADFSGMDGTQDLFVSEVIHQAFVKVDEKGTEAAAATAVVMDLKAAMPTKVFKADHPFIFMIQQKDTGNILFMGRVVDPSKE